MSIGKGWIGEPEQLLGALRAVGADQDENGNFLIYGEPVIVGMTGEWLVPSQTEYSIAGKRANLASLLADRGGGVSVTVIS